MFHFCFVPKVDGSIVQWSLIVAAGWPFYQKQKGLRTGFTPCLVRHFLAATVLLLFSSKISSASSDNGAVSNSTSIAPRVNKQMCIEKAMQQKINSHFR